MIKYNEAQSIKTTYEQIVKVSLLQKKNAGIGEATYLNAD